MTCPILRPRKTFCRMQKAARWKRAVPMNVLVTYWARVVRGAHASCVHFPASCREGLRVEAARRP